MQLTLITKSDESVGIYSQQYIIECPFEKEDVESGDLEYFKRAIKNAYENFLEMPIHCLLYDFEIERINEENNLKETEEIFFIKKLIFFLTQ